MTADTTRLALDVGSASYGVVHTGTAKPTGARAAADAPAQPPRMIISFFGHDAGESTIIKRASAFQANGAQVIGFMFKRNRPGQTRMPSWENIDLGVTQDLNYAARLPKLVMGLAHILRRSSLLRRSDVIYARNIDMLALAVFAKWLSGTQAIIAYEALDIYRVFVGNRAVNRLFRWAERRLLASSSLLVVSSPEYVSRYFGPVQSYSGPWHLLENKISAQQVAAEFLERPPDPSSGPPWVIGMFGVLKCARSIEILRRLAESLPERVEVHFRGIPAKSVPSSLLDRVTQQHSNIFYWGPYRSPQDLRDIYAKVHFTWAADFLDPANNSAICLPNRIYEGGLFGSVALAAAETATGRFIEKEKLGWTLTEPLEDAVISFFRNLDASEYTLQKAQVLSARRSIFVDESDTKALLDRITDLRAGGGTVRQVQEPDQSKGCVNTSSGGRGKCASHP